MTPKNLGFGPIPAVKKIPQLKIVSAYRSNNKWTVNWPQNKKKLAALIESDYALLKFGYYGQEYEFAVAERDPRYTEKCWNARTIINLSQIKDKQYRHETSVMMAVLADMRGITPTTKQENESGWYKTMFSLKAEAETFTRNSILHDVETDFWREHILS